MIKFLSALYVFAVAVYAPFSCAAQGAPRTLSYQVLREAAHDPILFTQGLLVQGDYLVESSGGYGKSLLRRYHATTGVIARQTKLPNQVFAEGLAQTGDHLFLLTWRKGTAYQLSADDFSVIARHPYQGEGWGLTYDGRHLVMSNGSDTLVWRDPHDFTPVREARVTGGGRAWHNLNELEYAQGLLWANVWQEDIVLAINPRNGSVLGVLDLSALVEANSTRPHHSVLNGIAYDKTLGAFWITGKLWPRRYLIKVQWPELNTQGNPPD